MAAARKKTTRKKPATEKAEKADAVEIAWRGKYEEKVEENAQLQQSIDALLESQFRVDWNEKAEELGGPVADHLRVILTTSRAQGRTRLMFQEVIRQTHREEGAPEFMCIVAANEEHRKFLQGEFKRLTGSQSQGVRREAYKRTRIDFITLNEDRMGKLRGLPGVVRLLDHYTVEFVLQNLIRGTTSW